MADAQLALFEPPRAGDRVRFPAPVAPGSATSRRAAEQLEEGGRRRKEVTRCLEWFSKQSVPRTRHELADALYPTTGGLGSACARVNDLMICGWIDVSGRDGKRETLTITDAGRRELIKHG